MKKKLKIGLWFTIAVIAVIAMPNLYKMYCEITALKEYEANFDPEHLDVNFRTLYERYPFVVAKKSHDVMSLPSKPRKNVALLKHGYDFYGSSRQFDEFLERTHTTGLMIWHDGELVYEDYFRGNKEDSQVMMASVSKSMASMLVGVAVADGLIDVNDKVVKYVPELKDSGYEDATVKDVLEMSSGIVWREDYGDLNSEIVRSLVAMNIGSLDEFAGRMVSEYPPGFNNNYASIDTHVVGMVLRAATGKPYVEYFEDKLWSKLGAQDDAKIIVDAVGEPLVFGGVNVNLRDMFRFGLLMLNKGVNFKGEQIVPAKWIEESTQPDSMHIQPIDRGRNLRTRFGYKYQWWTPASPDGNDFFANGIFGQFLYVNPDKKVVIAKTSAYKGYVEDGLDVDLETSIVLQKIAKELDVSKQQAMVE